MSSTPAHRRLAPCLTVAVGGAAGALARGWLSELGHHAAWATLCINVMGAFVLGLLLEHLTRTGERQRLRLLVGTGFCGAFTTYSTFAREVAHSSIGSGMALGLTEAVLGVVAAGLGAACAALVSSDNATGDAA